MLKVLVMDAGKQELKVREIENKLDEYYKIIGNDCRCIDIPRRKVGGKYFDIIVDDEGLLKSNPVCTGVGAKSLECMLFGTPIFTNSDDEGNTLSLSDEDISLIQSEVIEGFNILTLKPVRAIKMEY